VLADLKLPFLPPIDDGALAALQNDLKSSYLGGPSRSSSQAIRTKLHVPLEQAKGIGQLSNSCARQFERK